ncbi:uncharacterized protein [Amphiura filiformis]|uniref:uncharacterized protein n=1 Tax=Amphiura filiformis TaxID=82378 RepID=UPI003B21224F
MSNSSSAVNTKNDITRVMLWCIPRSTSTAFLKCMTYVPNTLAWYEPYITCYIYSKYGIHRKNVFEFWRKIQGVDIKDNDDHLLDIEGGGYLASQTKYSWLKKQLEAMPAGKKMIFCKDLSWSVDGHYEDMPSGFQHTFLIRNPFLTFDSWKRVINRGIDDDKKLQLGDLPVFYMPKGSFFKEQYNLYKYAKDTLGQNPPIVDTDELLANPVGVMKAYCKAIGVPYSDDYLRWEPGNQCHDKLWIIPKEQLYAQHMGNEWHEVTFKSTCFGSPRKCPDREDLPEDVVYYADLCMEYYEEMYANRLKPL